MRICRICSSKVICITVGVFLFFCFPSAEGHADLPPDFHCRDATLVDPRRDFKEILLRPRRRQARLINSFSYANPFEVEELILHLYEMGSEVSEFHIAEGDRDWQGDAKEYSFDTVLSSGKLDPWKDKITYHKVKIPSGILGCQVQRHQRDVMKKQMHDYRDYRPDDVLLEGDLDEIISRKALKTLKHCKPEGGAGWNLRINMTSFHYSLAYMLAQFKVATTATFFREQKQAAQQEADQTVSFLSLRSSKVRSSSPFWRPLELSVKDQLTGWHLGLMFNGSMGLVRKWQTTPEKEPEWIRRKDPADLADWIERVLYPDPVPHDHSKTIHFVKLGKKDLPEAVVEHPEQFPTILRNVSLQFE